MNILNNISLMNQFDAIRDILHHKTGEFLNDPEAIEDISPYMMQRWISMYSNHPVDFINVTINTLYPALSKEEICKLLLTSLPKYKYKQINYIKSNVKDKKGDKEKLSGGNLEDNVTKLEKSYSLVFGVEKSNGSSSREGAGSS